MSGKSVEHIAIPYREWLETLKQKVYTAQLKAEFSEMKGLSYRNLRAMQQWYQFYNQDVGNLATGCCHIAEQILLQIPWGQQSLSENMRSSLPFIEEIEAELCGEGGI